MKRLLSAIILLYASQAMAKTVTVAVIDTGIDAHDEKSAERMHVCKHGHKSFLLHGHPLWDMHGHGTHVSGLINKQIGGGDYCLVSLQYYSDINTGKENLRNMLAAIQYAINIKVDFINISGGGPEFNEQEYLLIEKALKLGIKVVVAAGNEHDNLDKSCNYYPACYDKRIISVGNIESEELISVPGFIGPVLKRTLSKSSNYGRRVSAWEPGTDLESDLPGGKRGRMSGTSQATAVMTGSLVKLKLSK